MQTKHEASLLALFNSTPKILDSRANSTKSTESYTSSEPCVTVVIPTYNSSHKLQPTLDALTQQARVVLEILIVDDASDDVDLLELLISSYSDLNIRLLKCARKGNAAISRNIGIQKAKFPIIALLDDDDLWHPFKIEQQVKLLKKGTIVSCNAKVCHHPEKVSYNIVDGSKRYDDLSQNIFNSTLPNLFLQTSTLLFYKNDIGPQPFDEKMQRHQDYQFVLNSAKRGMCFVVLNSTFVKYRYIPGSISNKTWNVLMSAKFMKNYLSELTLNQQQNFYISDLLSHAIRTNQLYLWFKYAHAYKIMNFNFFIKIIIYSFHLVLTRCYR